MVSELIFLPEARRRAYLDAMGIGLFVARRPLANALDSWLPDIEADVDVGDESSVSVEGEVDASKTPSQRTASPAVALPQGQSPSSPPVVTRALDAPAISVRAPEVSQQIVADAGNESLRFPVAVAVFEWPGRFRVLAQLRDGEAPSLDSREHTLWNDLAQAVAGRETPGFSELPLFRFPPGRHHRNLASAEHLADALHSLMQSRQARVPVPAVILFADAAVRSCLRADEQVLLLPSLREMLGDWTLKRAAWSALRTVLHH